MLAATNGTFAADICKKEGDAIDACAEAVEETSPVIGGYRGRSIVTDCLDPASRVYEGESSRTEEIVARNVLADVTGGTVTLRTAENVTVSNNAKDEIATGNPSDITNDTWDACSANIPLRASSHIHPIVEQYGVDEVTLAEGRRSEEMQYLDKHCSARGGLLRSDTSSVIKESPEQYNG